MGRARTAPWAWVWMGATMTLGFGMPVAVRAQFSPGKLSRFHESIAGPAECFRCHEPRKATTAERCLGCHRELGARIAAGTGYHGLLEPARRNRCGSCHAEHGGVNASLIEWPGGKRESFDHALAGFALTGKHAGLRCDDCHQAKLVRSEDVRASKSVDLSRTYLGLSPRCAGCHTDAHHGQFAARVEKEDCAGCHGSTTWKPVTFDHATARFALAGKHAEVRCESCHPAVNASGAKVAAGTPGSFRLYRPVAFASCQACHTDPHHGQFGAECARCHTAASWTQLASFDHTHTRYPLTNRHLRVACASCHWSEDAAGKRVKTGTPGSVVHYKPIRFAACTDCHKDPHQNRFGPECARCHSTAGWSAIAAGAFDHDRTRYPLRGRHVQVACARCHREGMDRELAFQRCTDCHADAHRGQLARRPDRGACESCHTVDGFTPARFGLSEHAATRFPLEGAHRAVACPRCHLPREAAPAGGAAPRQGFDFRADDRACAACHADPHAGQFAPVTDCARCHQPAAWPIARFDHDKTRFPLEGAHRRVACAACHRTEKVAGRDVVRYRPLDTACRACHAQPVGTLGK